VEPILIAVLLFVYGGMVLGGIPGFALDRTGVSVLGAVVLVGSGLVSAEAAWSSIDVPTMGVLFGLMVVSAQLRLGGFYSWVTRRVVSARVGPPGLLALVIGVSALLSAVLANDVVCLAMTPIVVDACGGRRIDPMPHLLGLAAAANVGSAATLIGNPQNMLLGQTLDLPFGAYMLRAAPPVLFGVLATWGIIAWRQRGRWHDNLPTPLALSVPPLALLQTAKGLAVAIALVAAFILTDWRRDVLAMSAGGFLLMSRRMASRDMLALIDWHLLLLFAGLFVVNHALAESGSLAVLLGVLASVGLDAQQPFELFVLTAGLSNVISNVPAVMLLLPAVTSETGALVALSSTFAGNLILVGSVANLIVAEQAARAGVVLHWREHARVGVPITIVTLGAAALALGL